MNISIIVLSLLFLLTDIDIYKDSFLNHLMGSCKASYFFAPKYFSMYFLGTRTFLYKHSTIISIRTFNIKYSNLQSIWEFCHLPPTSLPPGSNSGSPIAFSCHS